ncbi:MAG: glycosyltransferase [Spirochaetales bacterium]|nr:glycosyltransferase [Spirochaetales bacterium]
MAKVSVLMASHNGARFICQSLDSILNQTFSDFELIVINDASTDDTAKILEEYANKDLRVRVYSNEENKGLTCSLNEALKKVSADSLYICRMDDDDICEPNRLEKQIDFLDSHGEIGIVGSNAVIIDDTNNIVGQRCVPAKHEQIRKVLPRYNPIIHPAVMIKREVLESVGGYNEKFRTSQDYELWFRLAAGGVKFANLQENLLKYRETRSAVKRKSMKYRLKDFRIRKIGYKMLKLPFYCYFWLAVPLILGIIPMPIYKLLKRVDPRLRLGDTVSSQSERTKCLL